jgi:MoaA/NifB/PqqE/SkfB family radical SAM enzyme
MAHEPPLARYALRYAREGAESILLTRKPLFLTVFVTARCGMSCGHCFYREELEQGDIHSELSLAEFDQMTRKLPRFPKLIITGGEPFLRPDLAEITELFYENASQARQITIPTSGVHTERVVDLVRRVLLPRPDLILEIQLSIDGVGEDHDRVRGKGSFDKLMATYAALKPIQDENEGLRIRFNFTFSPVTQGWFEETFRYVTETLGNPYFDMVLVRRTTADDGFDGKVDIELYREATALMQAQELRRAGTSRFKRILAQRVQVERDIISEHHADRRVMTGCCAGTLTAIVSETGDLRPCEILDTSFGNLRQNDFDFAKLWNNGVAHAHRRFVKETGCFCTFETTVRTTMSFQPRWVGRMVRGYLKAR